METNNNNKKMQKSDDDDNELLSGSQEQHQPQEENKIDLDIDKNIVQDDNTTFEKLGVCPELCEACKRLKYEKPFQIQKETLPYTLKKRDIIGLAETGSGKTLAFALPIIQSLLDDPQPFFALILSPTRELCIQISEHFEALGVQIGLKSIVIVGGLDPMTQALALAKKPHIVIGTPGRILYHMQNTKGFNLTKLKFLVLDEADKLLNMDFEKEINQILEIIPKNRNTFLFSATMTNKVSKLQRASLHDPVKIESSTKYQTVSTLTQNYLFIPAKYKDCYLIYILNEHPGNTSIIFVTTCMQALRVCLMIRNLGIQAVTIHGQMSQVKRLGALNKFKSQEKKVLVATDVASRGLDIPSVDLVINFDIPQNAKDYVHRVGRTARAGKAGKSITLVTQYDVEQFQKIEFLINKKLDLYKTEEAEVLVFFERVQEAQRLASQEIKTLLEQKEIKNQDEEDAEEGKNKKQRASQKNFKNKEKNARKRVKIDI